ncbi:MAG: RDD family protein [Bacteroidota bacterium]
MEDFKHNEILDSDYTENNSPWEGVQLASFWQRVGASLVDGLVMIPIYVITLFFITAVYDISFLEAVYSPYVMFNALIPAAYKIIMEGQYGATLGKMAMRLRVVDAEAQKIDINHALRRYVIYGISLISSVVFNAAIILEAENLFVTLGSVNQLISLLVIVSLIFVAFDERKQAVHDKIADTFVIQYNGSYGGGFS